ncbi:MAG: shikimate dehydrogenase [Betaproteobacteria bacterium]|nr:shikimate dehydrogenase [Betaproteobacteria bacterium]
MTDRYAVIGHPVAHSRSPEIHAAFARQTGQVMSYERMLAPLDGFQATIETFRTGGGCGANVTLPFKMEAYQYANELTPRARQAAAVNTLKFQGAQILGDNTDGVGLCRDIIDNLNVPLVDARILVVGAGGAAHGVIGPLLSARPQMVAITNRTFSKAVELADYFSDLGPIAAISAGDLHVQKFDIIINATSASLAGSVPMVVASIFKPGALAYDMMYGKGQTPFMALAESEGARTADGLGMLVEQAAEAFFLWRGVRPATAVVIAQMRGA